MDVIQTMIVTINSLMLRFQANVSNQHDLIGYVTVVMLVLMMAYVLVKLIVINISKRNLCIVNFILKKI
jgi:hypothetical protein